MYSWLESAQQVAGLSVTVQLSYITLSKADNLIKIPDFVIA